MIMYSLSCLFPNISEWRKAKPGAQRPCGLWPSSRSAGQQISGSGVLLQHPLCGYVEESRDFRDPKLLLWTWHAFIVIAAQTHCMLFSVSWRHYSLLPRRDRDRQVNADEHSFQYDIRERGSQPLWERRASTPTDVRSAGEQCQPQADHRAHCRVWRPDQQRREVRVLLDVCLSIRSGVHSENYEDFFSASAVNHFSLLLWKFSQHTYTIWNWEIDLPGCWHVNLEAKKGNKGMTGGTNSISFELWVLQQQHKRL